VIFFVVMLLVTSFISLKREIKKLKASKTTINLESVFIFAGLWSAFQVVYLSMGQINYSRDAQTWLESASTFFMFLVVACIIDNCIQIKYILIAG